MKKLLLTILLAIVAVGVSAQEPSYKIVFDTNTTWDTFSGGYGNQPCIATEAGNQYQTNYFNNGQKNSRLNYLRGGSKNAATEPYIATLFAMPEQIGRIDIDVIKTSATNITSAKLLIADDATFVGASEQDLAIPSSTGVYSITVDTPQANKFYKVLFSIKKSSNGILQIASISYYKDAVPTEVSITTPAEADEEGNYAFEKGSEITFLADAGNLLYADIMNGEEVIKDFVSNPYTVTVSGEGLAIVYAVDKNGETMPTVFGEISWGIKKAAPIGAFTVTPDETTVEYGTSVTFTAENATEYCYEIDGELFDGNSFILTKDCEVKMTASNVDNSAVLVRNYTVEEPTVDRYKKITDKSHLVAGTKYILIDSKFHQAMSSNTASYFDAVDVTLMNNNNEYMEVASDKVWPFTIIDSEKEGQYQLQFDNGKFMADDGTTSGTPGIIASETGSDFEISFNADGTAKIALAGTIYWIQRNVNAATKRFKTYKDGQVDVYLYRLVDGDAVEAPEALYAHGHIGGALIHWAPVELTTNANGFSHESLSFFITEEEAEMDADAHFFLSAKPAEVAEIAPMTVEAGDNVDFTNVLNDVVYAPAEDTELTTGTVALKAYPANSFATAAEIPTFKAKANQSYAVDVDFSGFHPVMNVSAATLVSVDKVAVDNNEPVEYFNLQGVRVQNPANGVFIRRQGAVATKVRL